MNHRLAALRRGHRTWNRWLAPLVLVPLLACSDDATTAVNVGPSGPPSVAFVNPPGDAVEPHCAAIGEDVRARVPLELEVSEILLRPPGGCGSVRQCGHLELYANDVPNNAGAAEVIDLLIENLADAYHDGSPHPVSGEPDVISTRVEVVADDGVPLLDQDGEAVTDTVQLVTAVSCP